MSEDEPRAKVKLVPLDEEIGEPERSLVDPLLTPEEIEALKTKEDRGITLAPQYQPKDAAEMGRMTGNFYVYFDTSSWFSTPKRRNKAFQRFAILRPDLAQKLIDEFAQYRANGDNLGVPYTDEMCQDLYDAYLLMSQLVDENDRYVKNPDGTLSEGFLGQ